MKCSGLYCQYVCLSDMIRTDFDARKENDTATPRMPPNCYLVVSLTEKMFEVLRKLSQNLFLISCFENATFNLKTLNLFRLVQEDRRMVQGIRPVFLWRITVCPYEPHEPYIIRFLFKRCVISQSVHSCVPLVFPLCVCLCRFGFAFSLCQKQLQDHS